MTVIRIKKKLIAVIKFRSEITAGSGTIRESEVFIGCRYNQQNLSN